MYCTVDRLQLRYSVTGTVLQVPIGYSDTSTGLDRLQWFNVQVLIGYNGTEMYI